MTHPLFIRVFAGEYPLPSETFITTQAQGLIDHGSRVEVIARHAHKPTASSLPAVGLESGWRGIPLVSTIGSLSRLMAGGQARTALATMSPALHGLRVLKGHLPVLADALHSRCPGPSIWLCHYGHNGEMIARMRRLGAITGPIATVFHGFDVAKRLGDPRPPYPLLREDGDLFLPVSDLWRNALLNWGFPSERTHTCPLGIACDGLTDITRQPAPQLRILSVCRLVEKKGVEYALRAVAAFPPELLRRTVYRVAGDGPLLGPLRKLANDLNIAGSVEFLGVVDHARIPALLTDSDVFLLPSVTAANGDMEGVPISIIEAMAAGLPVVTTRHSGIPELITDGMDGLLVEERDSAALSARLCQLAGDLQLRLTLGSAARSTILAKRGIAGCSARLHGLLATT